MKFSSRLFFFLLLLPCLVRAQVALQIDSSTSVPLVVLPGSSFSLSLDLNNQTQAGVAGYDVDVEALAYNPITSSYAPAANDLALTGVTLTSTALNLPNSTLPTPSTPAVLAPQAGSSMQPLDFGASNLFTGTTVGQGVSPLETATFQLLQGASPGLYELEFFALNGNTQGAPTLSDNNGDSLGTATTPLFTNTFTVANAPEPPTAFLSCLAALAFLTVMNLRRHFVL